MLDFTARFADAPALVAPEQSRLFSSLLTGLSTSADVTKLMAASGQDDGFWFAPEDYRSAYRPYKVVDGILHIPVRGVLLSGFPWAYGSFATGYQYIARAFERGMSDPDVSGIALIINSPGGEVAENFDLVDRMYRRKGEKRIEAFAHEAAYSAAYSIASMADKITVSRTGGVGSIGVVTSHVDFSKALEADGIKVTFIFAGKHKVDGNAYEPLSDEVKARIQERIDSLYSVFVSTVARNRGMTEEAVRNTEALTYSAAQALSIGLADAIGPLDDALAEFSASLTNGEGQMSKSDNAAVDQAAIDTARAEGRAEGHAAGLAEGTKAGAAAERTRINAIIGSDPAKDRPKAALSAALKTDMSAEAATAFLADLPEEKAEETAAKGTLAARMDREKAPEIEANGGEATGEDDALSLARQVGLPGIRKRS